VDAAEIVEYIGQRQRIAVAFHALAEPVCQPGEPAHGQVLRSTEDVLGIGTAFYAALFGADAFTGAVATQRADGLATVLDQHGVVDSGPKGALYDLQVGAMTVGRELHPRCQPVGDIMTLLAYSAFRSPTAHATVYFVPASSNRRRLPVPSSQS
jgi:hypothetical protein